MDKNQTIMVLTANYPEVKVRVGLECKDCNLEDLKGMGAGIVTYGVQANDVIQFPPANEMKFKARQVAKDSEARERLVGVKINDQDTWLSLSALRRKDVHNQYHGEVLIDLHSKFNAFDDFDRCSILAGSKIVCEEVVTMQQYDFKTKGPKEKPYPMLKWLEEPTVAPF